VARLLLQQILEMDQCNPVFAAGVGIACVGQHIGRRFHALAGKQGGQRQSCR
jgi:hypothetical protein